MSETYGNRPMIGGEHYYKAVEPQQPVGGAGNSANGIPTAVKGILIGLACVVAVGALAFAGIMSLKPVKVMRATANTFTDAGYLVDDIQKVNFNTNKLTLSAEGQVSVEGVSGSGNAAIVFDGKDKQVYGSVSVPMLGSYEAVAELNSKEIKAQIPTIDSRVFLYNYKKNNTGYLPSSAGDTYVDMFNSALATAYDLQGGGNSKQVKKVEKILLKNALKFDYEKIDPVKVTVDGKSRKCSGIRVTIENSNIMDMAGDLYDFIEDEYEDVFDEIMKEAGMYGVDKTTVMVELQSYVDMLPVISADLYLYDGKIAAIEMPVNGSENYYQVLFHGGDYRLQNVEGALFSQIYGKTDSGSFRIEGSRDGKEDSIALYIEDSYIAKLSYDKKSGDFVINAAMGAVSIGGNLDISSKGIVLSTELPSSLGLGVTGNAKLSILNKAEMKKIKGDEFDLGAASEADLMSLVSGPISSIANLLGKFF